MLLKIDVLHHSTIFREFINHRRLAERYRGTVVNERGRAIIGAATIEQHCASGGNAITSFTTQERAPADVVTITGDGIIDAAATVIAASSALTADAAAGLCAMKSLLYSHCRRKLAYIADP